MRPSTSLAVLAAPSLCLAQAQFPLVDKLKGWLNQATAAASSYVPTAVPSAVKNIANPVDAGAEAVASKFVQQLDLHNWKEVLAPGAGASQAGGPEEWIIFINGENKTCYGLCGDAEKSFNTAVTLLAGTPSSPNFATVNCDAEPLLCNSWVVSPPSIYQFLIPKPLADQSRPATTVRYVPLNRTDVSAKDFLDLHNHPEKTEVYEGFWHPFDGYAVKLYWTLPWAYAVHLLSQMPSWMPMILVSLFSRTFMGRRGQPGQRAGQAPAGAAAPAPAR